MTTIVDRRNIKGKSAENRKKFLNRVREEIKDAIPDIINQRKIKDFGQQSEKIRISKKTLKEPRFIYDNADEFDFPLPGNKDFVRGDQIEKSSGEGKGSGSQASNEDDESKDDFIVEINREEFLEIFFEDLELPDLVKKTLIETKSYENKNA